MTNSEGLISKLIVLFAGLLAGYVFSLTDAGIRILEIVQKHSPTPINTWLILMLRFTGWIVSAISFILILVQGLRGEYT